jgi:hypothetical protein
MEPKRCVTAKLDRFWRQPLHRFPGRKELGSDEDFEIFGSAEGIHLEAGYRWNDGSGYSDLKSKLFSRPLTEIHDSKNRT